jgi:hypothetical protein
MTRRRSGLDSFRSSLYGLARLLGDLSAFLRGPKATARRLERRAAGKETGIILKKLFK